MIRIHIFSPTTVVYRHNAGVIWINRLDDYGVDSMFKVHQEYAYSFYCRSKSFLTQRYEVYYFNA